jgi:hypothetical protein
VPAEICVNANDVKRIEARVLLYDCDYTPGQNLIVPFILPTDSVKYVLLLVKTLIRVYQLNYFVQEDNTIHVDLLFD